MNEIEKYIVERLRLLESVVNKQEEEISAFKEELKKVEKMKALMREYFILKQYSSNKQSYIDHKYTFENVAEIAEFIGLEMDGEEDV